MAAAIAVAAYFPRFLKGEGLHIFPAAAECMLRGDTPLHCKTVIFAYPPVVALLAVPLALMPVWLRDVFWYLVLIGTLFLSLRFCEQLVRRVFPVEWSEQNLALLRVLTFVLTLKFILAVLENQAYDSIAFVLILLGLLALGSGRPLRGSASLAVAAAIKVTPLIFLPYLLLKRRYVGALVFMLVVVLLTLLPDIILPPKESWHVVVWVRDVILAPFFNDHPLSMALPFWVTDSPMNQSFHAALARVIDETRQAHLFTTTLRIIDCIYAACVGVLLLKSCRDDDLIPVDGALLLISSLLLSPVSSQSHFVALMLPYALIAAALIKVRPLRTFNALMLLVSFVLATATSNDSVGRTFTGWALWYSLPMWGTLLLVVPLGALILLRRTRRAAPAAPY